MNGSGGGLLPAVNGSGGGLLPAVEDLAEGYFQQWRIWRRATSSSGGSGGGLLPAVDGRSLVPVPVLSGEANIIVEYLSTVLL